MAMILGKEARMTLDEPEKMAEICHALSSPVRVRVMQLLANESKSVGEIAEEMDLPMSTAALAVQVLQKAGLIITKNQPGNRGTLKLCSRKLDQIQISLTPPDDEPSRSISFSMPIGGYSSAEGIIPTCGLASANIGFNYCVRNQNNPAQMRLFAHLAPSAVATWHFHGWRRPMALRYEVEMPLVGVMFSPNFGQSYYEIFSRGNYDHNVVVTTPFNAPSLRHMLSLDVSWGRHTLRVGYMGDYQQSHVNELKFHSYSHLLMVGYVRNFRISDIIKR